MFELFTILSLCTLVFLLVRRVVRKRRGAAPAGKRPAGIDAWIAAEVAGVVSKKLALSRDDVTRAMGGDPDADVVSAVERVVSRVEVVYERLAGDGLEVRVEVHFEDGTQQGSTRKLAAGEVPGSVRDELSRTGASRMHHAWAMPWSE
jgi:hypothetical protein